MTPAGRFDRLPYETRQRTHGIGIPVDVTSLVAPLVIRVPIDTRAVCGSTFGVAENPGNPDRSIKWVA